MPREPQSGPGAEPHRPVEWRDPRMDARPRDDDVRIDRRDRDDVENPIGQVDTRPPGEKNPPITR